MASDSKDVPPVPAEAPLIQFLKAVVAGLPDELGWRKDASMAMFEGAARILQSAVEASPGGARPHALEFLWASIAPPYEAWPDVEYLVQESDGADGCVTWVARDGGATTDIGKARVFSRVEAFLQCSIGRTRLPWQRSYVEERARCVVFSADVNRADGCPVPDVAV